jgi:hypothetical protein
VQIALLQSRKAIAILAKIVHPNAGQKQYGGSRKRADLDIVIKCSQIGVAGESLRGRRVCIVTSTCPPVSRRWMSPSLIGLSRRLHAALLFDQGCVLCDLVAASRDALEVIQIEVGKRADGPC